MHCHHPLFYSGREQVFLKQHLMSVVIDSHFSAKESEENKAEQPLHSREAEAVIAETNDGRKKKKNRMIEKEQERRIIDPDDSDRGMHAPKRRKSTEQSNGKKKKSKK